MKRSLTVCLVAGIALALASSPAFTAPLTKKAIKKIANQTITKRAKAFHGPVGPLGPVGPVGPAGPAAIQVYARILADGMVVPSRSVGIDQANVSFLPDGYCFNGLPPINGAQVTVDYFQSDPGHTASFGLDEPGCQGVVKIFDNGVPAFGGFLIILY